MQNYPSHKSIWQSFWDEWILVYRIFSFETILSPENCITRIQKMGNEALGCFNYACMQVAVYNPKILGTCTFTIAVFWRGKRGGLYKSIELQGKITSVNGKTHVAGTISEIPFVAVFRLITALSWGVFLPLLIGFCWWFQLGQQVSDSELAFCVSVIASIGLFLWSNIYMDRQNITKLIQRLEQILQ